MSKIIGIDLGTTNSVVCALEDGEPTVISNEEGGRTTPSVVAFEENGNVLVGQQARRQSITNPENTIYSAKRFMGRRFDEVKEEAARVPYEVVPGPGGDVRFKVRSKQFSPPEVSAHVLRKLKKAAEDYFGEPVTEAVITVPAYFNDAQRQATKDAGKIAGLEVRRIVNEPTAAALAFARGRADKKEHLVAVYDLGGGTFDISLLEVSGDVVEVVATSGDTHLGGDDFDARIIDWLLQSFKKETGIDASADKLVMQRLKDAAEKAKIELSASQETEINLPFLTADATGPKHMQIRLSRAKFESLIEDLVDRSMKPVQQVLKDAGKSASEVDEVLLVGGSTRVPLVQRRVEAVFGKAPNKSVNPDEVVGLGAAVQGGIIGGDVKDMLLVDVTPLSLGIETLGGVMTTLIPRNTTIPTKKSEVFTTAADAQPSVEVHVLQGERKMAGDNRTLAKFSLDGIAPAPRGMPQIEVTFDIDANGIVNASATDKATGKAQTVTIKDSTGLSQSEIEKMVRDAEKHAADDERRRKEVEERNALEALVFQTQRTMAEHGSRLPADARHRLEGVLSDAESALRSGDARAVAAVRQRLEVEMHELSRAAYAEQGGGASNESPTGERPPGEPEVIDAEFEEKAS